VSPPEGPADAGGCSDSGRPQEAHGSDSSTAAVRRSRAAMSRLQQHAHPVTRHGNVLRIRLQYLANTH
jgi:hypothetical protein